MSHHNIPFYETFDDIEPGYEDIEGPIPLGEDFVVVNQRRNSAVSSHASFTTPSLSASSVEAYASDFSSPNTPDSMASAWPVERCLSSSVHPASPYVTQVADYKQQWQYPGQSFENNWPLQSCVQSYSPSLSNVSLNGLQTSFVAPNGSNDLTPSVNLFQFANFEPATTGNECSARDIEHSTTLADQPPIGPEQSSLLRNPHSPGMKKPSKVSKQRRGKVPKPNRRKSLLHISMVSDANTGRNPNMHQMMNDCNTDVSESNLTDESDEKNKKSPCRYPGCGLRFQRAEHRKRHEERHFSANQSRKYCCTLALVFGIGACTRDEEECVYNRPDNLGQHIATHCYGHSSHSSRNTEVHKALMKGLLSRTFYFQLGIDATPEMREAKTHSVCTQLEAKIKTKPPPPRLRFNAHINHKFMSEIFPDGFLSCEDVHDLSAPFAADDHDWFDKIDSRWPWCLAKLASGPRNPSAGDIIELPIDNSKYHFDIKLGKERKKGIPERKVRLVPKTRL